MSLSTLLTCGPKRPLREDVIITPKSPENFILEFERKKRVL